MSKTTKEKTKPKASSEAKNPGSSSNKDTVVVSKHKGWRWREAIFYSLDNPCDFPSPLGVEKHSISVGGSLINTGDSMHTNLDNCFMSSQSSKLNFSWLETSLH